MTARMNVRTVFLLFFSFLLFGFSPSWGQISIDKKVDQYLKKGERNIERRIDRAVDKKTDEALDEVFDKKAKKKKKDKKQAEQEQSVGAAPQQAPEPKYYKMEEATDVKQNDFVGSFSMTVEMSRDGGNKIHETKTRNYYFLKDATAVNHAPTGSDPVTVIYHLEKNTLTTVKDGASGKVAIVINKPASRRMALSTESIKINALSSTREINGVACSKFMVETPDDFITIWATTGLEYNYDLLMRATLSQQQNIPQDILKVSSNYGILGIPMEMVLESKINDEIVTMKLSSFKMGDVDASIFDLSKADVTDMTQY